MLDAYVSRDPAFESSFQPTRQLPQKPLPPAGRAIEDWATEKVAIAEKIVSDHCAQCHEMTGPATERPVEHTNLQLVWYNAAKFDHGSHRAIECKACHAGAYDYQTTELKTGESLLDHKRIMMPGAFLPPAERYHVINRVDRWVIRNVLAWFAAHPVAAEGIQRCGVNLSGQSLGDSAFQAFVIELLGKARFDVRKLCLEVTETAVITRLDDARSFMLEVRQHGVRFALDDFGTGYSSLAYLSRMPFDQLKIDRSFVAGIDDGSDNVTICSATIGLARSLKLHVVAEGVETEAQARELQDMNCAYAQGYYFLKPADSTRITRMLSGEEPVSAAMELLNAPAVPSSSKN